MDRVLGDAALEVKHFPQLKYIEAVLRETLRLFPTAPGFGLRTKSQEDIFIGGGRYRIHHKDRIFIGLPSLHHDPAVWGDDAEDFRPERMLNGGWEALPPSKPVSHVGCSP